MQWKAINNLKGQNDTLSVPKITKNLDLVKWLETYEWYTGQKIGCQDAPLAYVIREENTAATSPPPLKADEPHSEKHVSVREELVVRLLHTHGLYREDNATVYNNIDLATRSVKYTASIAKYV